MKELTYSLQFSGTTRDETRLTSSCSGVSESVTSHRWTYRWSDQNRGDDTDSGLPSSRPKRNEKTSSERLRPRRSAVKIARIVARGEPVSPARR